MTKNITGFLNSVGLFAAVATLSGCGNNGTSFSTKLTDSANQAATQQSQTTASVASLPSASSSPLEIMRMAILNAVKSGVDVVSAQTFLSVTVNNLSPTTLTVELSDAEKLVLNYDINVSDDPALEGQKTWNRFSGSAASQNAASGPSSYCIANALSAASASAINDLYVSNIVPGTDTLIFRFSDPSLDFGYELAKGACVSYSEIQRAYPFGN